MKGEGSKGSAAAAAAAAAIENGNRELERTEEISSGILEMNSERIGK